MSQIRSAVKVVVWDTELIVLPLVDKHQRWRPHKFKHLNLPLLVRFWRLADVKEAKDDIESVFCEKSNFASSMVFHQIQDWRAIPIQLKNVLWWLKSNLFLAAGPNFDQSGKQKMLRGYISNGSRSRFMNSISDLLISFNWRGAAVIWFFTFSYYIVVVWSSSGLASTFGETFFGSGGRGGI